MPLTNMVSGTLSNMATGPGSQPRKMREMMTTDSECCGSWAYTE